MDTKVKDAMTHLVVTLRPTDTVHDAAVRLARSHISGAPVVEEGKVVGMLSEADLVHSMMPPGRKDRTASILDVLTLVGPARSHARKHAKTVADLMSHIVVQVSPDDSIWRAASVMEEKGVKRLPVVDDDDFLVGILSRADFVRAMARADHDIQTDVLEAIEMLGEDCFEHLDVEVNNGIATIEGKADRRSTRDLAIKMTWRVPGVAGVVDRLEFQIDDSRLAPAPPERNPVDPRLNWQAEEDVH